MDAGVGYDRAEYRIGDLAALFRPEERLTARTKQLLLMATAAAGKADLAAALYALVGSAELFATFTQNMRAFSSAAVGGSPFATTQAGFDLIRNSLRPERSNSYEVGGRVRSNGIHMSPRSGPTASVRAATTRRC